MVLSVAYSFGQDVSEEARRHYDYGVAAVKTTDYEAAIKEFEQATVLAPGWPEAFYNLGLAYEGAKKYTDAVKSYREYLRLAPNAGDATEVKSLVNELEYLAEREKTLTTADIVEILTSIGDEEIWAPEDSYSLELQEDVLAYITRVDSDKIKVPSIMLLFEGGPQIPEDAPFQVIKIEAPNVNFVIRRIWNTYYHTQYDSPDAYQPYGYKIEVLSKLHVKVMEDIQVNGVMVRDPIVSEYRRTQ